MTINCKGKLLNLSQPKVMGILNLTPNSFFDGGKHTSLDLASKRVKEMINQGVDIIDVGACSTKPGSTTVSLKEELNRLKFLPKLIAAFPTSIFSIDTFRSEVAQFAIESGAAIVNDISAGNLDKNMFRTVAKFQVPYIAMHMLGTPKTMQDKPKYVAHDVTVSVLKELSITTNKLNELGLNDIIIDPGFGFGKTVEDNYRLLKELNALTVLECPILVGLSRKSMISSVLNTRPIKSLNGTTILNTIALKNGANILRVHDVKEAKEVVKLHETLLA